MAGAAPETGRIDVAGVVRLFNSLCVPEPASHFPFSWPMVAVEVHRPSVNRVNMAGFTVECDLQRPLPAA